MSPPEVILTFVLFLQLVELGIPNVLRNRRFGDPVDDGTMILWHKIERLRLMVRIYQLVAFTMLVCRL